jgi:C-terminal processing protease CtpA/Prc
LEDSGRAFLIGETTAGKTEALDCHKLMDDSQLCLAEWIIRPLHHPEENWEKTGIVPNLTVVSNWGEVAVKDDPAVHAALEYLDNK